MAVFVLILFLLIVVGMVGMVYMRITGFSLSKNDNAISNSQEFYPFEEIKNNVIYLGNHKYRAIIECSSTSYDLKTEKEKDMIEMTYQNFVNSLTFPIFIYVQTTVFNNKKMLEQLSDEIKISNEKYPQLQEYAELFYSNISVLERYTQNNRIKRKLIIVPYEEAVNLEKLTDSEKEKHSLDELSKRVNIISDGISTISGIKAKRLNNVEMAKVIYSSMKKDQNEHIEDIVNEYYSSIIVEGDNPTIHTVGEDEKLDWVLSSAENKIINDVLYEDMPRVTRRHFEKCLQELGELRDKYAGYYKDNKK